MKYQAQQLPTKLLTTIMAGVAAIGFATAASAVGGGLGVNANVGAGAQVPAPISGQAGGAADAQMSTSGSANTNAQSQDDATRGTERADERMSTTASESKPVTKAELEASGKARVKGKH
ncbi:MAG TPA: hypothetical protein DCQ77_12340 [Betaproteobacteria bacterium]|nr:hypothetical protein [Betaproteobacteria bacterium]